MSHLKKGYDYEPKDPPFAAGRRSTTDEGISSLKAPPKRPSSEEYYGSLKAKAKMPEPMHLEFDQQNDDVENVPQVAEHREAYALEQYEKDEQGGFFTKRRVIWLTIVVAVIAGGVVGALFGTGVIGGDDSPSGSPSGIQCVTNDDGINVCALDNYPVSSIVTVFHDCPSNVQDGSALLGCEICLGFQADNIGDVDPSNNRCISCSICDNHVASDCSNLSSDPCAVQDCDGNCVG